MKIYKLKNLDNIEVQKGDKVFNKNDGSFYTVVKRIGEKVVIENGLGSMIEAWENIALVISEVSKEEAEMWFGPIVEWRGNDENN